MTFLEILSIIEQRKETTVLDKINLLRTNGHIYIRDKNNLWTEKSLPPPDEDTFIPQQKPLIFPVKSK
jgi:hypothetical protein